MLAKKHERSLVMCEGIVWKRRLSCYNFEINGNIVKQGRPWIGRLNVNTIISNNSWADTRRNLRKQNHVFLCRINYQRHGYFDVAKDIRDILHCRMSQWQTFDTCNECEQWGERIQKKRKASKMRLCRMKDVRHNIAWFRSSFTSSLTLFTWLTVDHCSYFHISSIFQGKYNTSGPKWLSHPFPLAEYCTNRAWSIANYMVQNISINNWSVFYWQQHC